MLKIIKINIDSIGAEDANIAISGVQMCTVFRGSSQSRKLAELRNVTPTWTAVQNQEIIKQRQWLKTKSYKTTEYFLSGLYHESDKKKSDESTQQIHKDFDDVFNGIGCFEGTFSLCS